MAVSRILSTGAARAFPVDGHLSCCGFLAKLATVLANCDYYPEVWPTCASRAGNPSSCSVLHRMGFIVRQESLPGRWALTPPFHPYLPAGVKVKGESERGNPCSLVILTHHSAVRRFVFCDTFRRPELTFRTPPLSKGMLPYGVRTFLSGILTNTQATVRHQVGRS